MIQKIGIWGCFTLGIVGLISTYFSTGFDDPVQYAGGSALILIGASFWLFQKNAQKNAQQNDKGEENG